MMTKITLEDKGQDLLWLRVNEAGLVEEAGPFQNEILARFTITHISFAAF